MQNELIAPERVFFNPETFAATFLRILNKDKKLIPLRYNRAQREFLANRTGKDILLKARQLGFSTLAQAELFRIATTEPSTTLTLTHLDSTTQAMRRMSDRFWSSWPSSVKPSRKYANATITTYSDFGSEAIIATAGSTNSARGITVTHAHLSEVAFWAHADEVMTSVLQSISPNGSILIESTANGVGGWFADRCFEALSGDSPFKLHFFEWWWDDKYRIPLAQGERLEYTDEEQHLVDKHGLDAAQIKWRRAKVKELTPMWFAQEFPESIVGAFVSSGNSVFGDFTHALYTPSSEDTPIEGHYYISGLDWGQQDDYTTLSIIDCDDNREVFLGRWRHMQWASIRDKVLEACVKWNIREIHPEKNSIGNPNIENLINDMQERGLSFDVIPFMMTNDRKASMVAQLYTAIHEGEFKLLDYEWATAEMRQFISKQTPLGAWTYGAADNFHDDSVVARMAAKRAQLRRI